MAIIKYTHADVEGIKIRLAGLRAAGYTLNVVGSQLARICREGIFIRPEK
jgi:hypothetical protein